MSLIHSFGISQINIIKPIKYNYTSFNGDKYSSLLYEGKYTNLIFTDSLVHDDTTCTKMSLILDSVWNYYFKMTGNWPNTSSSINQKGDIAFVSNTCGAGCAFIGTGKLEVGDASWINIYNNIKYLNNASVLKVAFYELGRNFYNKKIDENLSVYPFWIPEPYANMGYLNAIDYLGLYMKDQYENELGYKYDLIERANEFILDTNVKSISDVYLKNLYPNAYGIPEFRPFFNSALLMKLCFDFGDKFITNFYKELYLLPKTNGVITEAYTNFCIASSKAVNLNLKYYFLEGYKMPINEERVDSTLNSLPSTKITIMASDKVINSFYSNIKAHFRVKAISSNPKSKIKYNLYLGNLNDTSNLFSISTSGNFELPNAKFDYPFWVKVIDGINSTSSSQLNYIYRGNLLKDTSFEQIPNIYPNNSASSIEYYGKPYNGLLSASRDTSKAYSGKYSLRFNHSFFNACGVLTNSDFPTIDYTQSYIEPFKGRYKVSAKVLLNEPYQSCPNIVYGGWVSFGVRNRTFMSYPANTANTNTKSNSFQTISGFYDTSNDSDTFPKSSLFTIISGGIKGDCFFDDVSIKAALIPEIINIISINQDTSSYTELCKNIKYTIQVDSAQDISEYQLFISKDSTFANNNQLIKSQRPNFTLSDNDSGIYYIKIRGVNEFGQGGFSKRKIIKINPIPSAPKLTKDNDNFLVANTNNITWYKDNIKISDTTIKIKPTSNGYYSATTTQNGCVSSASANYFYITTSITNLSSNEYFDISPNPTDGEIYLKFKIQSMKSIYITVLDVNGRAIINNNEIINGSKLNLRSVANGNYIIQVKDKAGKIIFIKKLIKQ